jgi:hypothetical protein
LKQLGIQKIKINVATVINKVKIWRFLVDRRISGFSEIKLEFLN